ncbi:MAG: hypothetical protein HYU36_04865 [Planctomycetes bacterium]|nr:hypothetical protein [Planctomycetota bacterium]
MIEDALSHREAMVSPPDILDALRPVIDAFEALGIAYYVGGSLASSSYGFARSTLDVDLVADLQANQVDGLTRRLGSAYYADAEMILDAVQRKACFNLIHQRTLFKIDVFIRRDGRYDLEAFRRRRRVEFGGQSSAPYYCASAEDTILNKFLWFSKGDKVSDRQWSDAVGILKVQAATLERDYLERWAKDLGVHDLLRRALADAGICPGHSTAD